MVELRLLKVIADPGEESYLPSGVEYLGARAAVAGERLGG
jgi:hypothetical protein